MDQTSAKSGRQTCCFPECGKPAIAKGWCGGHYRQQLDGRPLAPLRQQSNGRRLQAMDRLAARRRIDAESGCWIWTGSQNSGRYGQIQVDGVIWLVHRLSFTLHHGEIGYETVHHTCARRVCFNPEHLQAVSARDNIAEMRERQAYRDEIARLRRKVRGLETALAALRIERRIDCSGG